MRAPKLLFGAIMAIGFKYSSATNEFNIPMEDTTLSSALPDSSTFASRVETPSYSTQCTDVPATQTDSKGLTTDSSATLTSAAIFPSPPGEIFSTATTVYSGFWNVTDSNGEVHSVWTSWEASIIYSQNRPIMTRLDLSQFEPEYQATPASSMETFGTVTSSPQPDTTPYDSTSSSGTPSGASLTVVTIYPVFSSDSQGSTKVGTDTRPAIVFPVIDSAGQTVLTTSTIFHTSSSSPYAGSTESVSVSQGTPTSDPYLSNSPPSSVEIPGTLISTKLSTPTSSCATNISLTPSSTDTELTIGNSSTQSEGSFSAPLRPVSDSTTIITITTSTPYSNTTTSSMGNGSTEPRASYSAPLRPVSDSTIIVTVPTSPPYPNITTSSPPYSNSTTSLNRPQPTHPLTNSTAPSTHSPPKCGDKDGHPAGTLIHSYLASEPLCANGTLTHRSPSSPNKTLTIDDVSWEAVTCYTVAGQIGPDAPLVYTINDGYRCFLYENPNCEVKVDGSRHKGGEGYKVGAEGETGRVQSYRCFLEERWAQGLNWARLYVGGPGYEVFRGGS